MSSDEDSASGISVGSLSESAIEFAPNETDEQRTTRVLKFMKNGGLLQHLDEWQRRDNDKSTEKSIAWRRDGNCAYLGKTNFCLTFAIDLFTASVAHAPPRSSELALAYANRSAMLIKARLYKDALRDIDRAMEAGYPANLRAKLLVRQAACFRGIGAKAEARKALETARSELAKMKPTDSGREVVDSILSDPKRLESVERAREKYTSRMRLQQIGKHSSEIVGASKAVALSYSKKAGRHLVATRDIKPGELVFIGEPYAGILDEDRQYKNCWHCFTQTWSAVPCHECSGVVYCSERCRDTAWVQYHEWECAVRDVDDALGDAFGLKLMIKAVKEAGNIKALRKELERVETTADPKTRGCTDDVFDGKKIASIFAMPPCVKKRKSDELRLISGTAVTFLVLLATRTKFFGEVLSLDEFVQHQDLGFLCGLMTRFIMIATDKGVRCSDAADSELWGDRYLAVLPFDSLLKHSCLPNLFKCCHENRIAYYAFLTIKKGDTLSISRTAPFWNSPRDKRRADLVDIIGAKCHCVACKNDWPMMDELPCYDELPLSREIRGLLCKVTSRHQRYSDVIEGENIDDKPVEEIVSNMISVIGSLCHHVPMPCQDTFIMMETLQRLYTRLANRYIEF